MVTVSPEFRARLNRVSSAMRAAAAQAMEESAEELVAAMKRLAPVLKEPDDRRRAGALQDSIRWSWNGAPKGTIVIGEFRGHETAELRITIYAGGKVGEDDAFYARWVEFGTQAHSLARNASVARGKRQDAGAMHPGAAAQPFFYPAYRANRRRIRSRIARAIKQAAQKG